MADKPRTFTVNVQYTVTVGQVNVTDEQVKSLIELKIYDLLFQMRQNNSVDVNIHGSVKVEEVLP